MYLVDTNVVSVGSPSKAVARTDLVKWMDEHSIELYLSAVTVAETSLCGSCDSSDVAAARVAGALSDVARSKGIAPGFADIVIAATAGAHKLIVLTRNTRHFEPLGVPTANPFERLPASS